MGRRACAYFVYPAPSLSEFLHVARRAGLVAKRLQFVHPFERAPARLALLELKRAKEGGLLVEPPIVEWAARGVRTGLLSDLTEGRSTIAAKQPAQRVPSNRSRTMATAARTLK
jgi:tRNA1(Val) A37 N6-methylase TrmN6